MKYSSFWFQYHEQEDEKLTFERQTNTILQIAHCKGGGGLKLQEWLIFPPSVSIVGMTASYLHYVEWIAVENLCVI